MTETEVIEIVAKDFGLTIRQIVGNKRYADYHVARSAAVYFCRKYIPACMASSTHLGKIFNRDHSTILYILQMAEHNPAIRALIKRCEPKVKAILEAESERLYSYNLAEKKLYWMVNS